ncbi:unnamed protein product [Mucor hiemalis]
MPSEQFNKAVEDAKHISDDISFHDRAQLFAFFQQATKGDLTLINAPPIEFFFHPEWHDWSEQKGTPQAEAELKYVSLVNFLLHQQSINAP